MDFSDSPSCEAVREFLSVENWITRDIPPPDRLLGDLLTTTTRLFLVGRTGLGKTLLAMGLAGGIASGNGFLHWRGGRPARVLYLDGEMPAELIKARAQDAVRRLGTVLPPGTLTIFARDTEEEFATRFPHVGRISPLNTEAGQKWLLALISALGGVDVVIFDNVMSLIAGDQKDEIPWNETLPLVQALTTLRVGQVWLDHTGHNEGRQYGSSTKAWRFDAVALMTPIPDDQREQDEVGFTLSFEHPGKARRRTPNNWRDFETCTVRLRHDEWTSESASKKVRSARKLSPMAEEFYRAFHDALVVTATLGRTTRNAWYSECVRTGLADPIESHDDSKSKDEKKKKFRVYMAQLKAAGLIGIDGETVTDLRAA